MATLSAAKTIKERDNVAGEAMSEAVDEKAIETAVENAVDVIPNCCNFMMWASQSMLPGFDVFRHTHDE